MSRKDYRMVAACIQKAKDKTNPLQHLVAYLVFFFKLDNNKFDEVKFYKACGLDEQ